MRQPLLFTPVYKEYLWGGDRIARLFRRAGAPAICAESWEISAHPDGPSVARAGAWAGETLASLAERYGRDLLGARAPRSDRFPLLFKIIDARRKLSVQVHPGECATAARGGEPKSEMWYVLDCEPGAELFAGLQPGTDAEALKKALALGRVDERLARLAVKRGDAFFIPGGLAHAIGEGCLLYEVQQNSNTTYRLYDWDRVGPDGKSRPLHVEAALAAIDWSLPAPVPAPSVPSRAATGESDANAWSDALTCPFFRLRRVRLTTPEFVPQDGESFHALFTVSGHAHVSAGGVDADWPMGTSGLVPAAAGGYRIAPRDGEAILLIVTL